MKWSKVAALSLFVAGTVGGVRADEGRIPIYEPTVITAPGHYVVTRDIGVASGSALVISATRATVDLNGHLLASGSSTGDVISILPTLGYGDEVTILNGRIAGGARGVAVDYYEEVRLERLNITGASQQGIHVYEAFFAEIVSCRVTGQAMSGVAVEVTESPSDSSTSARIVDNLIQRGALAGLHVENASGAEIRDNTINFNQGAGLQVLGPAFGDGAVRITGNRITENGDIGVLIGENGTLFQGNTVNLNAGCGIIVSSYENMILENSLMDNKYGTNPCGIHLDGRNNTLRGNNILGTGTGYGVEIYGSALSGGNLIEENHILSGASCALYLDSTTGGNVYRNNVLRATTLTNVCNLGSGNIDGGGNL